MTLVQKAYSAKAEALSEKRQVRVVVTTNDIDRSGEIVEPDGISWKAYMATGAGPVLWNHNANMPIAKCIEVARDGNGLTALVQFPPEGDDFESDKIYKRVVFGSIPGVSIGFQPLDAEPLDKGNPVKGPQRYKKSEMMEFSFTPIPCNPNALVVDKTTKGGNWKVGASRNLNIGDGEGSDVLDFADFDSDGPDTTLARKGFLFYDASNPDDRASYRLPFAKMVNGRMTVAPDMLKAAKAELETSEIPEDVAQKARAVIEHYEGKMTTPAKTVIKAGAKIEIKSLWHVAELARILGSLSWLEDCMEWDALYSDDETAVPSMLCDALRALGDTLINMTEAEVAALLSDISEDESEVSKSVVTGTATPMVKAFVGAHIKAGKRFSAASISTMQEACKAIKEGHDAIAGMMDDNSGTSDMEGTGEAETDKAKATDDIKAKRLRDVEVLRLKTSH